MFKNPRFFPAAALVTALALLIGLVALINSQKTHTPENVIEGTVSNFQDAVLKSPIPVYVEFYVSGAQCKPCIAEDPIVAKLATEYKGKVRFVRVDAMKNPQIAQAAGITGVPTHFFLKPAEQLGGSAEGFLDEAQLRAFLEAGLKMQKPAPDNSGNGTAAPDGTDPADQAPAVDPTKKDGK
jgi:thioredoxin 1